MEELEVAEVGEQVTLEQINMNKYFIGAIILGILCFNLVSAEVSTTANAFYANINEDGSITYTDTPVTDFQTVGYVCLNSACSQVGNKIDTLTANSSGNSVNLKFPTALQNSNGYGIWFYKPGYIQWEQKANFFGNGFVTPPLKVYLLKKSVGWAPIMEMHVVNEVHPNIPVEIGLNVSIDAKTYAALENAGPLRYNPSELNSINVVETNVTLKIKNSANGVIYSVDKTLNIPYSGSEVVLFNYPGFSQTGIYNVELTTSIPDDKISSSLSQFARTEIRVIPVGLSNYSFSLISGLSMAPVSPKRNENVDFGFGYNSSHINEFGVETKLDTNVSIRVYNNGVKLSEENSTLDDSTDYFSFVKSFSSVGNYTIIVEGSPSQCIGTNGCFSSLQEISFVIKEISPADITAPQITIISPVAKTYNVSNVLLSVTTDENSNVWFNLDGGANVSLGSGINFEYNLFGLSKGTHTVSVYARDSSNNQNTASVTFSVDLGGNSNTKEKRNSAGSRDLVYDGNSIANIFTTSSSDDVPLQIDLRGKNNSTSWLSLLLFWFLVLLLILIIVIVLLIIRNI